MFSCCPQFPHHVECFARIAVEDNGAIFCPRCPAGRRDHVDAGWFQRLCYVNGVDWPSPLSDCVLCADLLGTTGSQSRVATKKSTSVVLQNLSTHVVLIVHFSFNHCENSWNHLLFRQLQFFTDIM